MIQGTHSLNHVHVYLYSENITCIALVVSIIAGDPRRITGRVQNNPFLSKQVILEESTNGKAEELHLHLVYVIIAT